MCSDIYPLYHNKNWLLSKIEQEIVIYNQQIDSKEVKIIVKNNYGGRSHVNPFLTYHPDIIEFWKRIPQRSTVWYLIRCVLLGASDCLYYIDGPVPKSYPVKSRTHLWQILTGKVQEPVRDPKSLRAMMRGEVMEPYIRDIYAKIYNVNILEVGTYVIDDAQFMAASPDGLIEGTTGGIEIKSKGDGYKSNRGTMDLNYFAQCQVNMKATKSTFWDLVLYGNNGTSIKATLSVIRIFYSEEWWEFIRSKALDFATCIYLDVPIESNTNQSMAIIPRLRFEYLIENAVVLNHREIIITNRIPSQKHIESKFVIKDNIEDLKHYLMFEKKIKRGARQHPLLAKEIQNRLGFGT